MNDQRSAAFEGYLKLCGLEVPVRDGLCKVAVVIIGAALVTVPLLPFFFVVDQIFVRWQCELFVAVVMVANLVLTRFTATIAKRHPSCLKAPGEEATPAPDAPNVTNELNSRPIQGSRGIQLTIRDLMIAIAMIAMEFVLLRTFLDDVSSVGGEERFFWGTLQWFYASVLLVIPATIALTVLGVLRGRDPAEPLLHKPGATACVLATGVLFAVGYVLAISYVQEAIPAPWAGTAARLRYWFVIVAQAPIAIGLLTLASWNLLAMCGHWKSSQTRLERASRLVGRGWVICALIDAIVIPFALFIYFFHMLGMI